MWTEATWPGFRPLWKKNIFTLQCISSLLLATPWSSYVNLILSSWHTPTPRKKRSESECKKILNLHSDHVNSIQLVAWDSFKLAIPPAKQLVWSPWCHSPGMDISSVPRHRKVAGGISGLRTKGAAWTDASQADDLWVRNHAWMELERIWMKFDFFASTSITIFSCSWLCLVLHIVSYSFTFSCETRSHAV